MLRRACFQGSNAIVLGADGYIGFPLSLCLATGGFNVIGVDNFCRRRWVNDFGSHSATPILSMAERLQVFKQSCDNSVTFEEGDITDFNFVGGVMERYQPEVIIHLAEQASAPFSMMNIENAALTQTNNLIGTLNVIYAIRDYCPDCHLVKLGSMGEYQAVNIDIPEGFFEVEYGGRKAILPYPRHALTDWYHVSKVHDSNNIMLASEIWGLRSTDVMQGVVYGTRTEETLDDRLLTRFDFDAVFGTVLNRFCAQAVTQTDLTRYGSGNQKRPFISLRDALQCLMLIIQNPPKQGQYRVINQFDEVYSIREIAQKVKTTADSLGLRIAVRSYENPRIENEEEQYFNPIANTLKEFGFRTTHTLDTEVRIILSDLIKYRDRIISRSKCMVPQINWNGKCMPMAPVSLVPRT